MEYDTEKDIILKQLFEIRCDLKYLEQIKDKPNARLEKGKRDKKEGR